MAKNKQPSEEVQKLLKKVFDDCRLEDQAVRERQLRMWRRLKLIWEGYQNIYYSETAHDWRIYDYELNTDTDQSAYDKRVNVFKAYLQSIIAALSVLVPAAKCYPEDADDSLDLLTAKTGDKIYKLAARHNNFDLKWLHALFINVTEGMVAAYTYPDTDEKYGTYETEQHEEVPENHQITRCSACGAEYGNEVVDEFEPSITDEENQLQPEECPECQQMQQPQVTQDTLVVTRLVGKIKNAKSRVCLEPYGGLYIKIPNYAKRQENIPYLIFSQELDYSIVLEEFEHLHDKIHDMLEGKLRSSQMQGGYYEYAQWARLSPQYQGEYPVNVVTVDKAWIRPCKFNILNDTDDVKRLKKLYPHGVKVTYVNNEFAEACDESLDDHWTLTDNPLADFIHFEPDGNGLVGVQEITNDLISLTLQTIEHGISQTFADPGVLSFKAYEQTEVTPGGVFPATPKSGRSLADGFHDLKTATLSGEVMPFMQSIQSFGQLTSGALPSLFGGNIEGSETASQYSMSRNQALQRLQNTWKMFTSWWKEVQGKVIPMYIKIVKEQGDEREVQKTPDGGFVNVFIRKAELEGSIGKIELEANETLPQTWAQQKDTIEKLMMNANPIIQKMLSAPENLPLIHDALGISDFYVPGEDDVIKQYDEIKILLNSEPMPSLDEETGEPRDYPSVEIDPMMDNHAIQFDVCRKWAISEAGQQAKAINPNGYKNVLLHAADHFSEMGAMLAGDPAQQMTQPQDGQEGNSAMASGGSGAKPQEKPNPLKTKEAPITGEGDVQQVH